MPATIHPTTFAMLPKAMPAAEALVFLGCGGDLAEWTDGLTAELDGIVPPVADWFSLTTTGGRVDLVLPLPAETDIGRLAIKRLQIGDCSWWSDYRKNCAKHHQKPKPTVPQPAADGVRYPAVRVKLTGRDGNAFAVMGRVREALKKAGVPADEIAAYTKESMSGDYNHLLQTAMAWVDVR